MDSPFKIPEKRTPMACTQCRHRKAKCKPVPSESKCEGCKKRNTECEYKPVAGSSEPSPSASYAFDAVPSDFAGHSHSQAYVVPNSPYGRGPSDPSQAQTHAASGSSYGPPDSGHRDIHLYCDPPVVSQYPDLRQVHPSVAMSDGSDWGQSTADSPEHFRGIPNSYLDYDYNMAQESTTYPSTHFTSSSTIGQPSGYGGSQDPHSLSLASFPPMCICDRTSLCQCSGSTRPASQ